MLTIPSSPPRPERSATIAASRKRSSRALVVAGLVGAIVAVLMGPSTTTSAVTSGVLEVSTTAEKVERSALDGATISGIVYVELVAPDDTNLVEFFIDGKLERRESKAPFDLGGGTETVAKPFDTTTISDGPHELVARVRAPSGRTEVTATFAVANAAAPTTTTQAPPTTQAPTTTTTQAPTTTTTQAPTTATTQAPTTGGWQMTKAWYEANTGPVGTLAVHHGSLATTRDGQVIENLHVTGDLIVKHSGVTIRNCRIDGTATSSSRVRIAKGRTGTVIERCEIGYDGAPILANGIAGSDAASRGVTVRNTFIHRSNDGVKLGTNGRVEYSLIVLTEITDGAHSDGIQMMDGSGQRVYRNWFVSGNGSGSGFNANVWISQNMGPISDVVIEENHFAGSGFQVKLGSGTNVLARNNVHSPDHTFGPYKDYRGGLTVEGATYIDGARIE